MKKLLRRHNKGGGTRHLTSRHYKGVLCPKAHILQAQLAVGIDRRGPQAQARAVHTPAGQFAAKVSLPRAGSNDRRAGSVNSVYVNR
eukprot:scaffold44201_cov80-Cyclotella_meneghiniana.AAC.1